MLIRFEYKADYYLLQTFSLFNLFFWFNFLLLIILVCLFFLLLILTHYFSFFPHRDCFCSCRIYRNFYPILLTKTCSPTCLSNLSCFIPFDKPFNDYISLKMKRRLKRERRKMNSPICVPKFQKLMVEILWIIFVLINVCCIPKLRLFRNIIFI